MSASFGDYETSRIVHFRFMIGSDTLARQLVVLGVEHVALNPGATLRGLHESLLATGAPHPITCLHEAVATGLAHGYAKAAGNPMAVALHDTVGLLNASLALYNLWADAVPALILGGIGPEDTTARRPWIDWVHTSSDAARPIRESLVWAEIPRSLDAALTALRRAYQRSQSGVPGPAFVGIDLALQELETSSPPAVLGPLRPWRLGSDPEAIRSAVESLERSERPAVVADRPMRAATGRAVQVLAERLGAPVVDLEGGAAIPVGHPLDQTHDRAAVLRDADRLLLIDVRDSGLVTGSNRSADDRPRAIQIGLGPARATEWMVTSSDAGVDVSIVSDPGSAIEALLDGLPARPRAPWRTRSAEIEVERAAGSLTRAALADVSAATLPAGDVVIAHGGLDGHARRAFRFERSDRYLGRSGGEGLGYALPASIGAALALRDADDVVLAFLTDGDTLYLPQAFWTAAHESIPLLAIIADNRGYRRDALHQRAVADARGRDADRAEAGVRIDDPAIDLSGLARSMGVASSTVTTVDELAPALRRAAGVVRGGAPALVVARTVD